MINQLLTKIRGFIRQDTNEKVKGNIQLFEEASFISNSKDSRIKINLGCGTDYREGFINIDGSDKLERVDKIIDISKESLRDYFLPDSVNYILANDIIEHHFHWEAISLLSSFYKILAPGGMCEIRVPDCEYIIKTNKFSLERRLVLLFGGQDIPQGVDKEMDVSRQFFPQYFCHKYGWTMDRMAYDLEKIGFQNISMKGADSNFITIAQK